MDEEMIYTNAGAPAKAVAQQPPAAAHPSDESVIDSIMHHSPPDLKSWLEKDLAYLDLCRTTACDMLNEELGKEKVFHKNRTAQKPAQAPAVGAPQAAAAAAAAAGTKQPIDQKAQDRATAWLNRIKSQLQYEASQLAIKQTAADQRAKAKEDQAALWEKDVTDLIARQQSIDGDIKKTQDLITALQAAYNDAHSRGSYTADGLSEDLNAAKTKLTRLQKEKNDLPAAIDATEKCWQDARDAFRQAKAGKSTTHEPTSEDVQVELKQNQELLKYITDYQNELIACHIEDHRRSDKETA